jgi:hypothetical protein
MDVDAISLPAAAAGAAPSSPAAPPPQGKPVKKCMKCEIIVDMGHEFLLDNPGNVEDWRGS